MKRHMSALKKRFTASKRKRYAKAAAVGLAAAGLAYGAHRFHKNAIKHTVKSIHLRHQDERLRERRHDAAKLSENEKKIKQLENKLAEEEDNYARLIRLNYKQPVFHL